MGHLFNIFFGNKKTQEEQSSKDERCEHCHSRMIIRDGKYGKFLGCSNYPKCSFTQNIKKAEVIEYFGTRAVSLKEHITIISGKRVCYNCNCETIVSGLGLVHNETRFVDNEKSTIRDYGYDIYIVPWSGIMEQLPKRLQEYAVTNYNIQLSYSKIRQSSYYANVCESCGRMQGDNYVYVDTGASSPFDVWSKEQLILEKIKLKNHMTLHCLFDSDISPSVNYLKRSSSIVSNYIL